MVNSFFTTKSHKVPIAIGIHEGLTKSVNFTSFLPVNLFIQYLLSLQSILNML